MRRIALLFLFCTAALALNAQRLPDTVTPHHYILKFSPDLKTAKQHEEARSGWKRVGRNEALS